jgi:hypothetical protein
MESGGRETRIARRQGTRSEDDARAAGRNSKTLGESSLEPRLAPALDRLPQQLGQDRAIVGGEVLFGHLRAWGEIWRARRRFRESATASRWRGKLWRKLDAAEPSG